MHSGCAPTLPPMQTSSGSCQRIGFAGEGDRKEEDKILEHGRWTQELSERGWESPGTVTAGIHSLSPASRLPLGPALLLPRGSAGQLGSAVLSALPLSVAGRVIWWGWGWGPALTQPCFPLGEQF